MTSQATLPRPHESALALQELPTPSRLELVLANPTVARAITTARSVRTHAAPVVQAGVMGARIAGRTMVAKPAPTAGRLAGRFLSGRSLSGQRRTDATFTRAGTKPLPGVEGHTRFWSFRPGYARLGIRFFWSCIAWASCYWAFPLWTILISALVGAVAAVWGGWGLWQWSRTRRHRTTWVQPLHDALKQRVPTQATRPEQWLTVPEDFREPGAQVRVELPADFDGVGGSIELIKQVVVSKLQLDKDTVPSAHTHGNKPYITFTPPRRPPERVPLADILDAIRRAADGEIVLGKSADGVYKFSIDQQAPHGLLSAGTGAGKSWLLRCVLSQGLSKGGYGVIIDIKRCSHPWAKNLPNVEYYRDVGAIHDALIGLQDELRRRSVLIDEHTDIEGHLDPAILPRLGPRYFVVVEEMNETINALTRYWRDIKDKQDPPASPAVQALGSLLFMGREPKMHVLTAAQLGTARALGGPEMRENFGIRFLARYTVNAWRMLIPHLKFVQPPNGTGLWQVVIGSVATLVRVASVTPREARALALAGHDQPDTKPTTKQPQSDPDPTTSRHDRTSTAPRGDAPSTPGDGSRPSEPGEHRPAPLSPASEPQANHEPLHAVTNLGPTATAKAVETNAAQDTVDAEIIDTARAHDNDGRTRAHLALVPNPDPADEPADASTLVGLRQAVQQGLVGTLTYQALRSARDRDRSFPDPQHRMGTELRYDAHALRRWYLNRETTTTPDSPR